MASRKGIEPLTPGLGNLCSILLSYREQTAASSVWAEGPPGSSAPALDRTCVIVDRQATPRIGTR